jgi:hypothetical protein
MPFQRLSTDRPAAFRSRALSLAARSTPSILISAKLSGPRSTALAVERGDNIFRRFVCWIRSRPLFASFTALARSDNPLRWLGASGKPDRVLLHLHFNGGLRLLSLDALVGPCVVLGHRGGRQASESTRSIESSWGDAQFVVTFALR